MRLCFRSAVFAIVILGTSLTVPPSQRPVQGQINPTLRITAPANGAEASNPVSASVDVVGVSIKPATAGDRDSAHLHYFVDRDPAGIVQQGQGIPSGQPDIIHSGETTLAMPAFSPGQHTIWVVLGHLDHTPYNPSVEAKVSFTVRTTAQASPAAAVDAAVPVTPTTLPASGDNLSAVRFVALLAALALLCGGYSVIRLSHRRR